MTDPPARIQLITEWSTNDPGLAEMLRSIAALPEFSPERLAAEAALHTWQAGHLHRLIGREEVHDQIAERNRKAGRRRRKPEGM